MKILISSCLLGNSVRYDGGHKLNHFLKDKLGNHVEWKMVCPETESGMPTPREPMHLEQKGNEIILITLKTQRDLSEQMHNWIKDFFSLYKEDDICGFVFKSKSPSCGFKSVKIWSDKNILFSGKCGLFASECISRYPDIPCIDEGRLNDPDLHDNFIEQIFVYNNWSLINKTDIGSLYDFHIRNKYLIMAHEARKFDELESVIRDDTLNITLKFSRYESILMKALRKIPTTQSNSHVLQLMTNQIKTYLSSDNIIELMDIIDNFKKGVISLRIPLTFLSHYARVFKCPLLQKQTIFNPYPQELNSHCK